MNMAMILAAAVISTEPIANPDFLEPSVENEVRQTLTTATKFKKALDSREEKGDDFVDAFVKGLSRSDAAIKLVSAFDAKTGCWREIRDGVTNNFTIAAMKRLDSYLGVKPLKVLGIGNSFTISLQAFWPNVARECGTPMQYAVLYIGGCELSRHAENIDKAAADPSFKPYAIYQNYCGRRHTRLKSNIQEMLKADRWDVVTIQQASHESWRWESYPEAAAKLVATIRELAPQAKIVVQQTWSYSNYDKRICDPEKGGAGTWGFDQTGMYERLRDCYDRIAKTCGFEVIRVGDAVQAFRRGYPVKETAQDVVGSRETDDKGKVQCDPIHLNSRGQFLQALVWQKFFFPKSDYLSAIHPGDSRLPKKDDGFYRTLKDCLER